MQENITVKIGADISSLSKSLGKAESDLSSFGKSIGGMSKALAGVAAVGFGALSVGVGKSVSMFIDFDSELRKAGAIAGASAEEFDKMKDAAIDLGGKSSKSASEIAKAYTELAAKGFNANQVMAAMPGIVSAAEASGTDLAMTADTIASALNIWGLEAKESSKVADVLAMSANVSAAGIEDLAYVMQYSGAPAAALGISLEEVAAAAGIMANAGISGSSAGTSLRASLLALNSPAEAQSKMMNALGISTMDAGGQTKSLAEIIDNMTTSLAHMTEAEKVATLSKLVGTEAVSGFLALMKSGPTEIEKMSESLRNSGGASQEAADKMKAGIGGALEQLKGSVESVALSIGDVLAPDIKMLATRLSEVDTTKLIAGFKDFYESGKDAVKVIGQFLDKWSPLLAGIAAGVVAFKTITFGVAAYNAIMAAYKAIVVAGTAVQWSLNAALAANPIGAVVIAIGLLVAAGVLLYKNWDKIKASLNVLWATIKTQFNAIKTVVTATMTAVKTVFTNKWDEAVAFLKGIDLASIGGDIVAGLVRGIGGAFGKVTAKVRELANLVPDGLKNLLGIHSPSRITEALGEFTGEGFVNGLASQGKAVKNATASLAKISEAALVAAAPREKSSNKTKARAKSLLAIIAGTKAPKIRLNEVVLT